MQPSVRQHTAPAFQRFLLAKNQPGAGSESVTRFQLGRSSLPKVSCHVSDAGTSHETGEQMIGRYRAKRFCRAAQMQAPITT